MNIFQEATLHIISSRPKYRSCFLLAVSVLSLVAVGGVLLFAVSELPQEPLRHHLKGAAAEGYFAHNYPKFGYLTVFTQKPDMYTECVGIGIATTMLPTAESLLSMSSFGECEGLTKAIAGDFTMPLGPYMRYPHGYQIFLKPLYTFFPLDAVRLITCCMTIGLLALLFVTLRNNLNTAYAAVVVLSFFMMRAYSSFLLVTHAAQFWLVLAGAIAAVCLRRKVSPFLLFGTLGTGDTFFSFLSMGSLSLGLPMLCYALTLWNDDKAPEEIIATLFWGGIGWSIGFVLPWLVKWTILECFLHVTTDQVFGRTLELYPTRNVQMIATAIFNNVKSLQWQLCLVICGLLFARKRRLHRAIPAGLWAALLPALVPFIWVCILPGQSGVIHSEFVNLIFWPFIAALFLLLSALPKPPHRMSYATSAARLNEDHA